MKKLIQPLIFVSLLVTSNSFAQKANAYSINKKSISTIKKVSTSSIITPETQVILPHFSTNYLGTVVKKEQSSINDNIEDVEYEYEYEYEVSNNQVSNVSYESELEHKSKNQLSSTSSNFTSEYEYEYEYEYEVSDNQVSNVSHKEEIEYEYEYE